MSSVFAVFVFSVIATLTGVIHISPMANNIEHF